MYNVNSIEIKYTRTNLKGVLAGIPTNYVVGVQSREAGQELFDKMVKDNPDARFDNLEIRRKS